MGRQRGRRPATRHRLWAALAAAVLLVALLPVAATAQPGAQARLHVTSLVGVLGPGANDGEDAPQDLRLRVLVENTGPVAIGDLRVVVEVFAAARFRSVLHRTLDAGGRLALLEAPVVSVRGGEVLRPGEVAGVSVEPRSSRLPWRPPLGRTSGAYPLRITLLHGAEELDEVTTAVIYLAEAVSEPLETVLVWPLDGPPDPDGAAATAPGGRLDRLLTALERVPDAAVVPALGAHLLEDLAARAAGDDAAAAQAASFLDRLRRVLADRPTPVVGSYADADLTALLDAPPPADGDAAAVLATAVRVTEEVLGAPPASTVFWATGPLSREALDLVAERGADQLLLPADAILPPGDLDAYPPLPPPLRTLVTPRGRRLTALVPDPYLARALAALDTAHGPLVAAQRILAETAVLWGERPNAPGRVLVVLPPPDWDPPGRLATELLSRLAAAPWIRLVPPAVAVAAPDRAPTPAVLHPATPTVDAELLDALAAVRRELAQVTAALLDPTVVGGHPIDVLDRLLLRVTSRWWGGGGQARAVLERVRAAVDAAYGEVEVPGSARVTLTSEVGSIPVTIRRTGGAPLRVRVVVSARANLEFPEGQERELTFEGPGTVTLSLPVRVRATGALPVTVTVTDPSGARVLATGTIPVRATAISRPALLGTGALVLVLVLAGVLRRPRRPPLEVVR